MTKPTPDETALKCHLFIEESNKIVEDNALAVCDVPANPQFESNIEVEEIRTEIKPKTTMLGTIMSVLYNLEEHGESEKPAKIDLDLDLYQMEKV